MLDYNANFYIIKHQVLNIPKSYGNNKYMYIDTYLYMRNIYRGGIYQKSRSGSESGTSFRRT